MKILVAGGTGLLGRGLMAALTSEHQVIALGRFDLDITRARETIEKIGAWRPDLVIHAAALREPDAAEQDPERAYVLNTLGTRHVAAACRGAGCPMMYISTDNVFDGTKAAPYHEFDLPNPINVYGMTKWKGEAEAANLLDRFYIVRIPLLFGPGGASGRNYLADALEKARRGEVVSAPTDLVSSPTYTLDVARGLSAIVAHRLYGTYHVANSGQASRYEFLLEAFRLAGLSQETLKPIRSLDQVRPARRPQHVPLDCLALRYTLGFQLPPWQDALAEFVIE